MVEGEREGGGTLHARDKSAIKVLIIFLTLVVAVRDDETIWSHSYL